MPTVALEIHDAGILAVDGNGPVARPSPGFALYDGGTLLTGKAALDRARLKPRWVQHRFWQDLDTQPLGRPFPRELSAADLAHAQLSEVWSRLPEGIDRVLLALPGSFSDRQLGLIVGIARSCGMPVAALVDAAVAACTGGHPGRRLLHLDIQLHRTVFTELETGELSPHPPPPDVVRRRIDVSEGVGLVALWDVWARRIAELFVHATRFDPLHSAATEQALFKRLPGWLEKLRSEEVLELTVGPPGRERSLELTRPDVVSAADPFYEQLTDRVLALKRAGEELILMLSHRLAELPGLEPRLAELRGLTTVPLPPEAAAAGALQAADEPRVATAPPADGDAALPFITRLRLRPPADEPPEVEASVRPPERPLPTHLLVGAVAYPITEEPFQLGVDLDGGRGHQLEVHPGVARTHCSVYRHEGRVVVEDHSATGTFVGGERVDGRAALTAGDRLRLGNPAIEVQLITVVADRLHPSGAT